ncbi:MULTISPECIES: hypothetical protein [Streptomyces]|uniref:hypothetical protein n=1 Tax=Streptomyces TaxID=1883 RepID=UPI003246C6C2
MHWYLLGTAALMASGLVVCGAVAVRTGWVLPWQRRRVVRPEMWGYGLMLFGAGLLVQMAYSAFDGPGSSETLHTAAFITGLLLMIAGAWLQLLSTRRRLDA